MYLLVLALTLSVPGPGYEGHPDGTPELLPAPIPIVKPSPALKCAKTFVAAYLITQPRFTQTPKSVCEWCQWEFIEIGLANELLEAKREWYHIAYPWLGVDVLRDNHTTLKNAPKLFELHRFHHCLDRDFIAALRRENEKFQNFLVFRRSLYSFTSDKRWLVDAVLRETIDLYGCWDALYDASNPHFPIEMRRSRFKTLRERIGEKDFYAGVMPPHVPVHHFMKVD